MRLLSLELRAFGPFSGATLDLAADGPRLHVVHGNNEAGKSTTLRALSGLLYGIPVQTRDAHTHPMPSLRVGARIALSDGAVIDVVRRKGSKNTLLDPDDNVLDEGVLQGPLGGVGEELFRSMFGLDHAALREGARALLRGEGNVGESLFDAGLGGRGVHATLEELEQEADKLFLPRGKKRQLNEAISAFKQQKKAIREQMLRAETWRTQEQGIEEARAEVERLDARRRQLAGERDRLDRMLEADRDARQAAQQAERIERELEQLESRREGLSVPESLARVPQELVEDLRNRLGSHRKARADRPQLEAKQRAAEEEALAVLAAHGHPRDLEQAEALRPSAPLQARVQRLAAAYGRIDSDLRNARRNLDSARQARERLGEQLGALAPARDVGELERAIGAARKLGDAQDHVAEAEGELARSEARARDKHTALGLWEGPLEQVPALAVPTVEKVERFAREHEALERERDELASRVRQLDERDRTAERRLAELQREGEVPTEAQLGQAREARDALWQQLRRSGGAEGEPGERFEGAMREADELSDRLRREAHRVSIHAQTLAERDEVAALRSELETERERIETRRAEHEARWRERWEPAGIEPLTPAEMRGWLRRLAELAEAVEQLEQARQRAVQRREQLDARRGQLERALEAVGEPVDADEPFDALLERAASFAQHARQDAQSREQLEARAAEQDDEIAAAAREVGEHEAELESWRSEWREHTAALGLAESAHPEEAQAVLSDLDRLFSRIDEARSHRRRIEGIDRDAEQLEREVDALVAEHLPELAGKPLEERAQALVDAFYQARHALEQRQQIDRDLADKREQLAERREEQAAATRLLAELRREAGAEDEEAFDPSAARVRREEIERDVEEIEEERQVASQRLGQKQQGLEDMRQRSSAEKANDAQAELARVKSLAHRWVRLRLATSLLRRELERYREQNQGPILARANELFPRLTLGAYQGLKVGVGGGDEHVLLSVREDGTEVGVDGLSDGTRDQLYLALRLATLERHAAHNEPLPLVLDDVLVQLDDERARAALAVLGELAGATQVLFFTHHARLVELAREAVPAERLREHDLDALRARPGAEAQPSR